MITIELTETDVSNLLGALNSITVKGEEQMLAVLNLAAKLRKAAQESLQPVEAPKEE